MKLVLSLMSLVIGVSVAQADNNKTKVVGVYAICDCGASDNGVPNRVSKITGSRAASNQTAAIELARSACKKKFSADEEIYFDGLSCSFHQAISQTIKGKNKEVVKMRIERLTGSDEANLQADLMSTLNN